MVPASAMQELFYPQYQTEIKVHGEWVNTTKPLFPGYLICDTSDPRTVQQYLLRMDDFARVLAQDGQFVPLAKEEAQLISSFTHRGDRVVPMSEALKNGDQVVVTAGPLLGHCWATKASSKPLIDASALLIWSSTCAAGA
nr:hypothetical protein [Collinsella aerofaciens]